MSALAVTRSDHVDRLQEIDSGDMKAGFNKRSFVIRHTLAETGLFTQARIAQLSRAMIASKRKDIVSALNFKSAQVQSKFTDLPQADQLTNAVENIGETGSWIKLTRIQDFDPEYREVLDDIIDDMEALSSAPIKPSLTWATMTIFMASPGIATPYHIDHESNFLFQVAGEKDVCLFDQNDRELVPDSDIERFYNGNAEAARYLAEYQDRGTVYHLTPGLAVHHPPLAPHWVKNGGEVSISVSVGLCMKPLEERARIYQANFLMRKLRMNPTAPGRSRVGDAIKTRIMSRLEKRNPKTYREVVFSPMDRLKAPLRLLRP